MIFPTEIFLGLIGLPIEDGEYLLPLVEGMFRGFFGGDPDEMAVGVAKARAYYQSVVDDRTANPRDPATDFVSSLLTCKVDGKPVPPDDVVTMGFTIMIAGLDTTRSALGYIFHHLATHPVDRQHLIDHPERIPDVRIRLHRGIPSFGPPRDLAIAAPFWAAIDRHEITLPKCSLCGKWQWYPDELGTNCTGGVLEWVAVPHIGTVHARTRVVRAHNTHRRTRHRDRRPRVGSIPYAPRPHSPRLRTRRIIGVSKREGRGPPPMSMLAAGVVVHVANTLARVNEWRRYHREGRAPPRTHQGDILSPAGFSLLRRTSGIVATSETTTNVSTAGMP